MDNILLKKKRFLYKTLSLTYFSDPKGDLGTTTFTASGLLSGNSGSPVVAMTIMLNAAIDLNVAPTKKG